MFWILILAMTALVVALLALSLWRGASKTAQSAVASDVAVYKAQLEEIDRDAARGILNAEDAETVRVEVSRRLLAADARSTSGSEIQKQTKHWPMALFSGLAVSLCAFGLYAWLGASAYPDLPHQARVEAAEEARRTRPDQTQAELQAQAQGIAPPVSTAPEYLALVERLRAAVAERPNDLRGHVLLARSEARLGNFSNAADAQERLIALRGTEATVEDHIVLADYLILATGGYVSPQAERVLGQVIALDPNNQLAGYYSGLMFNQTGRPDLAFGIWRKILSESQAEDPWVEPIRAQIMQTAQRAGAVRYELPPLAQAPGPSQADIEAAQDMSPEDRMAMIQSMVEGLNDRLATEGGTASDWARLINAYGVLGNLDSAKAIFEEAKGRFAQDAEGLAQITAVADRLGLRE
ncbi:MAG: c-type cytochrome biogenesis protein CcmI [Pseudomonadota bacterium]